MGDFKVIADDWRCIPFFPEYEINSQHYVRLINGGAVFLKPDERGGRLWVNIRDVEASRNRRVPCELLWRASNAGPQERFRIEFGIRPEMVYNRLLADVLSSFSAEDDLRKLKPADRLVLLRLLRSSSVSSKPSGENVVSIDAMRRYAQKMDADDPDEEQFSNVSV